MPVSWTAGGNVSLFDGQDTIEVYRAVVSSPECSQYRDASLIRALYSCYPNYTTGLHLCVSDTTNSKLHFPVSFVSSELYADYIYESCINETLTLIFSASQESELGDNVRGSPLLSYTRHQILLSLLSAAPPFLCSFSS